MLDQTVRTFLRNLRTHLGNLAGSTLGSLYGILGNPATSLATQLGREVHHKDQWSQTPIAQLTVNAVAADLTFASVTFPVGFLPAGAVIQDIRPLVKCRKIENTNAADNAINGANKRIRVKKAAGAWGVDDVVGITLADNQWYTEGSGFEGGDMIEGDANIMAEVDDIDNETYNFRGENTNRADAPVVDAISLILHDVYSGLRVYYTLI